MIWGGGWQVFAETKRFACNDFRSGDEDLCRRLSNCGFRKCCILALLARRMAIIQARGRARSYEIDRTRFCHFVYVLQSLAAKNYGGRMNGETATLHSHHTVFQSTRRS